MNDDETERGAQLRAQQALGCLIQLSLMARAQLDVISWQKAGGIELENFIDAIEKGLPHPLFAYWEQARARKRRPGPGLRERQLRRFAIWVSLALQDTGLGKKQARKRTAKALAQLVRGITHRAVERWELAAPPLDAAEQRVINAALERCGRDPEALVRHFLAFVNTIQLEAAASRLFPPNSGDADVS